MRKIGAIFLAAMLLLEVRSTEAQVITGSGTPGQLAKFVTTTSLGNSVVTESNLNIGIGTASPQATLHVNGLVRLENGVNTIPLLTAFRGADNLFEIRASYKNGETNLFIGKNAGMNADPLLPVYTEANNTGLGFDALRSLTSGFKNTAIGSQTLFSLTVGNFNSAFGNLALASLVNGEDNIGFGQATLYKNISGKNNVAIGTNAGQENITGSHNTFVGKSAGLLSTGSWNTFIGRSAGANIGAGDYNVIIGGNNGSGIAGLNNHILIADGQGNERLRINNNGAYSIGGGYGTAGQILVSNGAGSAPAWQTISANTGLWTTTPGGDLYNTSITGKVGIGITDVPAGYKLAVAGGIIAEKIKIKLQSGGWPDYVFEEDYKLRPLKEVESFIKQHKHLPGMMSAAEMKAAGMDVEQITVKMLEKIEELTLYILDIKNEIDTLKKEGQ